MKSAWVSRCMMRDRYVCTVVVLTYVDSPGEMHLIVPSEIIAILQGFP